MTSTDDLLFKARHISQNRIPKVDYHLHTSWTDGNDTVEAMYNAAVAAGLERIVFSEHVRKTSAEWFPDFSAEVKSVSGGHCQALIGAECKIIDFDGTLDIAAETARSCDIIIASVHRFPNETSVTLSQEELIDIELRLACLIAENPMVDILGHPFGMCYRRFNIEPAETKIRQLIEKCAETGVAFEINAQYHRVPWKLLSLCMEYNALVSLGSDAHTVGTVGNIVQLLKGKELL
ncbi:MAG: PHP domain-containing protein [Nitrospirae bacterium]|nr:PHP domain-containing protein [Nitrospirota bacterium]